MNIKTAKEALKYAFMAKVTPHFIGLHGIGKSAIVYQFAQENGYEVAEIRVGQMADAGDLIGLQEFLKDPNSNAPYATRHILPDWFMQAVGEGKKVIIFIDELNRGHKDLLQAIFELVYDRRLKGVKIGENCHIVAASNPATDNYAVLDFSDSAFQDRFVHIKLDPTLEEFLSYGKGEGKIASAVTEFIAEYPAMLEDSELQKFNLDFVKPSRRSWDRVSKILATNAPKDIEFELVQGTVGTKAALAFRTFTETHVSSLKADKVLNDYASEKKNVKMAVKKGRKDLLATLNEDLDKMLKELKGLTKDQADNLCDLIEDLPVELAYALAIVVKNNSAACLNVEGLPENGLFNYKKFTKRVIAIKAKRDEMQQQTTK